MSFFSDLRGRLAGFLWGDVVPELPPPPPGPLDARLHAIGALLDYLATVRFGIDDSPGPPRAFRIPRKQLLDEWPDDQKDLVFPTIAVEPGAEPTIVPRGLANDVDESTRDLFGPGTVVLPLHEHQEKIVLHVWATTRFQRAAIVSGLESAFDAAEEMSGIRLALPDYFGQVARFTLEGNARVDDPDSARRRRTARLTVRMEVDVCRLVRAVEIEPTVEGPVVSKQDPTIVVPPPDECS